MIPFFDIQIAGFPATILGTKQQFYSPMGARTKERVKSISIRDFSGTQKDSCKILLKDGDQPINNIEPGVKFTARIGYENTPGVTHYLNGLTQSFGNFEVSETRFEYPVGVLEIKAESISSSSTFKSQKVRSWHDITIEDIVKKVAREHKLGYVVDPGIGAFRIPHYDQAGESDSQMLTTIAYKFSGLMRVYNGRILFVKKGATRNTSGVKIPAISIPLERCIRYNAILNARAKYQSVNAYYLDYFTGEEKKIVVGTGTPAKVIFFEFGSKEEAIEGATSMLVDLGSSGQEMKIKLYGDPRLRAETQVKLEGFRQGIPELWFIDDATHQITTDSGYITDLKLRGEGPVG